jgi:exopolyphosphatase/guanosine-5'-triphosphate,3'-diphosphate pyrophosphatase
VKHLLEKSFGFPIQLISGKEEAELSFWSVEKEFPSLDSKSKVVFDIGGASTEIVWGNQNGPKEISSLPIGCVLLTEEFQLQNRSESDSAFARVREVFRESSFYKNISSSKQELSHVEGFGVAGTMTSLIAIEKNIAAYDRNKVHASSISRERVYFWRDHILSLSLEERKKVIGLEASRADVFGGGLVILSFLMEEFGWDRVRCADAGVRFGLLYQMAPTSK